MRKNYFNYLSRIVFLLIVFSLLMGCGGKNKEKPNTSITASATTTTITNAGGDITIVVNANAAWTATANNGAKVSPSSGKSGTTNVVVSIPANTSSGDKTYTITFTAGTTKTNTTITQTSGTTAQIKLSSDKLDIPYEVSEVSFEITCSGDWEINKNNLPEWIVGFDKDKGKGDATVTIKTNENNEKQNKTYVLTVKSGRNSASILLQKASAPNRAPSKPTNLAPKGSNAEIIPLYTWTASTDADEDEIKYTVKYSKDNQTWKSIPDTKNTEALSRETLEPNTTYYYKVVANDGYEGGVTESDVASFTTGTTKSYYADCEYKVYQTASSGAPNPVVLIFTGDGYTPELYKYGGQFDTEVDSHIEALFDVEPYKTYRNYFTIYKIAAYSNETGMSVKNPAKTVDTRFKCIWEGGNSTGISCDFNSVIEVVQNIPVINSNSEEELLTTLSWSPVSIVINEDQYAGTCTMYKFGQDKGWGFGIVSIANTPARSSNYDNTRTQVHEFGGHGFGLLADEYVYYDQLIPDANKQNRERWKGYSVIGAYGNVTFINDPAKCEWAQFIGHNDYTEANIGLYAGALTYSSGVWRSEESSCMINNILHFNTQSRWQIYRRIMITAYRDENRPNIVEFVDNDKVKVNPFKSKSPIKLPRPHTPPIMYDNGRLVK